jgi:hypothetical protein
MTLNHKVHKGQEEAESREFFWTGFSGFSGLDFSSVSAAKEILINPVNPV